MSTSIKDLAKSLKSRNQKEDENTGEKEKKTIESKAAVKPKTPKKTNSKVSVSNKVKSIEEIIEESNAQEFEIGDVVYIDKDIHDILKKLKGASQLKISSFVSFLLEEYIRDNIEDIKKIINKKNKNKFL